MIRACIFDMDGTVVNSIASIAYFANKSLVQNGLSAIPAEQYRFMVGNGAKNLVHRMIAVTKGTPEQEEKVLKEYNAAYDADPMYLACPYDGIIAMFRFLKSEDIKVGILSNKPDSTTKQIAKNLFGALVDDCNGGREGIPLKPNPQALLALLKQWNIPKEEILYIGDSAVDIALAKNAEVFSVGVSWGFRGREELEQAQADCIVDTPSEIVALIRQRNS